MSDELLIGLAGGAIGAVLAGAFAQAGRAWSAWGEVTLHDEEATERNQRLGVWVDDRTRELEADLRKATATILKANPGGTSGAHGRARAHAKELALHQFRDEE